jgi:hypothetical protein
MFEDDDESTDEISQAYHCNNPHDHAYETRIVPAWPHPSASTLKLKLTFHHLFRAVCAGNTLLVDQLLRAGVRPATQGGACLLRMITKNMAIRVLMENARCQEAPSALETVPIPAETDTSIDNDGMSVGDVIDDARADNSWSSLTLASQAVDYQNGKISFALFCWSLYEGNYPMIRYLMTYGIHPTNALDIEVLQFCAHRSPALLALLAKRGRLTLPSAAGVKPPLDPANDTFLCTPAISNSSAIWFIQTKYRDATPLERWVTYSNGYVGVHVTHVALLDGMHDIVHVCLDTGIRPSTPGTMCRLLYHIRAFNTKSTTVQLPTDLSDGLEQSNTIGWF